MDLETWIRSLLAATSPLGTEAVVFKTGAEVPLPVEFKDRLKATEMMSAREAVVGSS